MHTWNTSMSSVASNSSTSSKGHFRRLSSEMTQRVKRFLGLEEHLHPPKQDPDVPVRHRIAVSAVGLDASALCADIAQKLGVVQILPSTVLDQEMSRHTEAGNLASEFLGTGKEVPTLLLCGLLKRRISLADCLDSGWLINGFPNTAKEIEYLGRFGCLPDVLIVMSTPNTDSANAVRIYSLEKSYPTLIVTVGRNTETWEDVQQCLADQERRRGLGENPWAASTSELRTPHSIKLTSVEEQNDTQLATMSHQATQEDVLSHLQQDDTPAQDVAQVQEQDPPVSQQVDPPVSQQVDPPVSQQVDPPVSQQDGPQPQQDDAPPTTQEPDSPPQQQQDDVSPPQIQLPPTEPASSQQDTTPKQDNNHSDENGLKATRQLSAFERLASTKTASFEEKTRDAPRRTSSGGKSMSTRNALRSSSSNARAESDTLSLGTPSRDADPDVRSDPGLPENPGTAPSSPSSRHPETP